MRPGWKARPVYNPLYREGKCASIQAGLAAVATPPDGILVASVDQPLDAELLNALLSTAETEWEKCDAAGRRSIIVPAFHGRPGHPPLFRAPGKLGDQPAGHGGREQGVAPRHNPHRLEQLGGLDVLDREAARSGAEGFEDVFIDFEGRQDQDAYPPHVPIGDDASGRFQAIHVWHPDVHQNDVRPAIFRQGQGLFAGRGFAHHLDVRG